MMPLATGILNLPEVAHAAWVAHLQTAVSLPVSSYIGGRIVKEKFDERPLVERATNRLPGAPPPASPARRGIRYRVWDIRGIADPQHPAIKTRRNPAVPR